VSGLEQYESIMRLAFEAEQGLDEDILRRYGRTYPDRHILIREGQVQRSIFWILSGEVYVTRRSGNAYRVMATLGEGEIIGEMSFFDKSVRSATVISKGEVRALVFSAESFRDIFAASPQWSSRLLLSLSQRIRAMIEKLAPGISAPPGAAGSRKQK
jgi:CRP/FNR family cyclic AMP-dependent transcriptional regulator